MIFTLNNALIHQSQYQDCILCSYVLPHVPCKIKVYFFQFYSGLMKCVRKLFIPNICCYKSQ